MPIGMTDKQRNFLLKNGVSQLEVAHLSGAQASERIGKIIDESKSRAKPAGRPHIPASSPDEEKALDEKAKIILQSLEGESSHLGARIGQTSTYRGRRSRKLTLTIWVE